MKKDPEFMFHQTDRDKRTEKIQGGEGNIDLLEIVELVLQDMRMDEFHRTK